MKTPTQTPTREGPGRHGQARNLPRFATALAAVGMLTLASVVPVQAVTEVVQKNQGKLVEAGPVNAEHGFPSWYEDSAGTRLELCLDAANPYCGLLPGDVPNEAVPISFPDNFPEEAFYMLAGSELELPSGGRAVLTLGLEAAFSNAVQQGDQVVFGRQRITVRDAPANTTLTFTHPYGVMTIDTDADGAGKLVEDISPANGNFDAALKSNIGPFLRWDSATAPAAPAGYLGNPDQEHTVVGSPFGHNRFSLSGGGLEMSTDQFTVQGKISTNTGVDADRAVANGDMIDVFATSKGTQLQVDGQEGSFATTPMEHDPGTNRFYARIRYTGERPTSVKVSNIGDVPVSTSTVDTSAPHGITVHSAHYDGTTLDVSATSRYGRPLSVTGLGELTAGGTPEATQAASFPVNAPPQRVTVKDGEGGSAAIDVEVLGGDISPEGLPAVDPEPVPDPDPAPNTDPAAAPVARAAASAATLAFGGTVELDGGASTGAASYQWTQLSGPPVTIATNNAGKTAVSLPFFTANSATTPADATSRTPITLSLVVTNSAGVASEPTIVQLGSAAETVSVDAGTRHRVGKEFKVTGTATLPGATEAPLPRSSVVIYDTTPGAPVTKLGTAPVDTLNAWQFKLKPGPSRQITSITVQSTRGGHATTTVSR
jgi:hypothetical protein